MTPLPCRMRKRSSLAALLFFLLCPAVLAQNLNLRHYGIRDGLPQTQIRSIHQDNTGYLWVGSFGGLGRYDGRGFTVFSTEDGLSSNNVSTIASTADGTLWAGTTNGACFLAPGGERFECLQDPVLAATHVTALLPAPGGGLWIGTENGLFKADAGRNAQRIDPGPAASTLEVTGLAAAPGGDLWIGTRLGLYRLADGVVTAAPALPGGAAQQIKALLQDGSRLWIGAVSGLYFLENGKVAPAANLPTGWTQDDINALASDGNGTLWAASDQGILRRKEDAFQLFTTRDGLMSNITFTIEVDRESVVWIGHDDGLSKHVPGPFAGYTEANGLLHYFVRTINEDALGRLWLGTRAGAQIVSQEAGDWQFERSLTITSADGLRDERVYSIALPTAHEAYLATGNGVAHWREERGIVDIITRTDGLPTNATQALRLQDGRLWIGTNLGVRYLENGRIHSPADPELAEAYVYKIEEDALGRLWFGSQDQGLFMRARDGSITRFGTAQGLTDETLWDIAADANGGVWVGSNGDGLYHLDAQGGVVRYTTADGLIDNFIWQVIVDATGDTWTYTNRGISRFDGERFHSYTEDDGLLHLEGGATGAWQTRDGQLWFASARGLMRYDPARERRTMRAPLVIIQNVVLGDTEISDGAQLPYQSDSLNIHYAALSFQNEDELRYRYRLLGVDEQWSEPVPYRPITYASLGAGEYVFEVHAQNPDGVTSAQPARFRFSVASPYWATTWFWLTVTLAIAAVLWGAYRFRIRRMEAHRRELQELVTQRTRELEVANEQLKAASLIDPLTGLHNRRFLIGQIDTDLAQSRRAHRAPAVFPNRDIIFMMIDIDNFKEINDTFGHIAGDRVLRQYAQLLRAQIRESDYVVRWGGEEFLIVARQAESTQSNVIAGRILDAVRATAFEINDDGGTISCTCSIGISHFPFLVHTANAFNWEQIVDIADMAVYMAKANGRNGWVAIHGTATTGFEDGAAAARSFREDLKSYIDAGRLRVDSSFAERLEITLIDRHARHGR